MGGPLAALRDGDIIEIDIPARVLNVHLSEREGEERMRDWTPPQREIPPGFLRLYARYVGAASQGAIFGIRE